MAITRKKCEEEEKRLGHLIVITVVSVDFVLRHNTGKLVETLALKIYSSCRGNTISCGVVQLSTAQFCAEQKLLRTCMLSVFKKK